MSLLLWFLLLNYKIQNVCFRLFKFLIIYIDYWLFKFKFHNEISFTCRMIKLSIDIDI